MIQLEATDLGCIVIGDVPFQKGTLNVRYSGNNLTCWLRGEKGAPIINNIAYTGLTADGVTPFASLAALRTFVKENFYLNITGMASGEGSGNGAIIIRQLLDDTYNGIITDTDLAKNATLFTMHVYQPDTVAGGADYKIDDAELHDREAGTLDLSAFEDITEGCELIIYGKID